MNAPSPIEINKNAVELNAGDTVLVNEYAQLAERAGFFAEDIVLYQLRGYIRDAGLREYPLSDVENFLDRKFGRPTCTTEGYSSGNHNSTKYIVRHKWGWHPLRKLDTKVAGTAIGRQYKFTHNGKQRTLKMLLSKRLKEWLKSYPEDLGKRQHLVARTVLPDPYNRLIPFPVLKTVEEITQKFPSVNFIVADWETYETTTIVPSPKPDDPFLAVLGPGIPLMIIERWDEPNFR